MFTFITRRRLFWLAALLIILCFNYGIADKERILAEGSSLLLPLAPIDPRSLMQGDYMQLEYAINRKLPYGRMDQRKNEGLIVVKANERGEAVFTRIHAGEQLAAKEYLLRYGPSSQSWSQAVVRPDSFFFQEGQAGLYEQARYGLFRCRDAKPCLLVGLADEDGVIITPFVNQPE